MQVDEVPESGGLIVSCDTHADQLLLLVERREQADVARVPCNLSPQEAATVFQDQDIGCKVEIGGGEGSDEIECQAPGLSFTVVVNRVGGLRARRRQQHRTYQADADEANQWLDHSFAVDEKRGSGMVLQRLR